MGTIAARWKCSSACGKANLDGSLKEFIYTCGGAKDLYPINLSTLDAAMISQKACSPYPKQMFFLNGSLLGFTESHISQHRQARGNAVMETDDTFVCLNHNRLSDSNATRSRRRECDSVESIHQLPGRSRSRKSLHH